MLFTRVFFLCVGGGGVTLVAESLIAVLFAGAAAYGLGEWWILFGEEGLIACEPLEIVVAVLAGEGDVVVGGGFYLIFLECFAGGAFAWVGEAHVVVPLLFAGGESPLAVAAGLLAGEFDVFVYVKVLGSAGHIERDRG